MLSYDRRVIEGQKKLLRQRNIKRTSRRSKEAEKKTDWGNFFLFFMFLVVVILFFLKEVGT